MNVLDREVNRAKLRQEPKNKEQATVGSITAKHVIGIVEADRAERRAGRMKNLARLGLSGLLAAKGSLFVAERITKSFAFIQDRDLTQLDGSWFTPSAVGIYGLSRVFRFMQNNNNKLAENRMNVFREEYDASTGYGDFATGAINTLIDFHASKTLAGELDSSKPQTFSTEDFLHKIQPTIPESNL